MGRIYDATWGGASPPSTTAPSGHRRGGTRRAAPGLSGAGGRRSTSAPAPRQPGAVPAAGDRAGRGGADPHMVKRLRAKLPTAGTQAQVVEASAESLPFEDASFDTVAFTLVLHGSQPRRGARGGRAGAESRRQTALPRALRSEDAGLARWQDRLEKRLALLADGCHCNRDTVAAIEASPLSVEHVEQGGCRKRRHWSGRSSAAARRCPGRASAATGRAGFLRVFLFRL